MANKLSKDTMAYKNKLKYISEYNKKRPKVFIQLNPKTEGDMIEWLETKRKATYIKQLIRDDMEKNKAWWGLFFLQVIPCLNPDVIR